MGRRWVRAQVRVGVRLRRIGLRLRLPVLWPWLRWKRRRRPRVPIHSCAAALWQQHGLGRKRVLQLLMRSMRRRMGVARHQRPRHTLRVRRVLRVLRVRRVQRAQVLVDLRLRRIGLRLRLSVLWPWLRWKRRRRPMPAIHSCAAVPRQRHELGPKN